VAAASAGRQGRWQLGSYGRLLLDSSWTYTDKNDWQFPGRELPGGAGNFFVREPALKA
jgi:hypothetical protein